MSTVIEWDDEPYVIKLQGSKATGFYYVHEYLVEPFGIVQRTSGIESPEQFKNFRRHLIPNFTLGLGRYRTNSDSAFQVDERRRFWIATADTRFESGVYNPILAEDSTETGLEVIRASCSFGGDLWAMWEDGTASDVVARKYTGSTTTWEGGGDIKNLSSGFGVPGFDIIAHKTHMIAIYGYNAAGGTAVLNSVETRRSTDGGTWSTPANDVTQNRFSEATSDHQDFDGALLSEIGGELVVAVYFQLEGSIEFETSTDAGDNISEEATIAIPSGGGPKGIAVMPGVDNENKLYVGTREGLWEIDTAPSPWTAHRVFEMLPHDDNCRRMAVGHDGALWFAQGVDDDSSPIVYNMFIADGRRTIQRAKNDFSLGDGLPAEAMGPIRRFIPANGMMYAASGGGKTGRNASIWCHNGKGWHRVRRHGTENQKIHWMVASGDDDGTPRLHYAVRTATGTSDTKFLAQPFVDPASGVSIKREDDGYVEPPYLDWGLPLDFKTILRVGINAEGLSSAKASGAYVDVDFGIGTDLGTLPARNANTGANGVGDFLSGTRRIALPSSAGGSDAGKGLAALAWGCRVNLNNDTGTNTNTPIVKDVEIDALVQIDEVRGFRFIIDIDATAKYRGTRTSVEAVVTKINTARALQTLGQFSFGAIGTLYVKARPPFSWSVSPKGGSHSNVAPDVWKERGGTIEVHLEEAL